VKKETVLFVGVALIVGLLVGILFSQGGKGRQKSPAGAPAGGQAINIQQDIQRLEGIVAADPGNRNAWVQLGHNYFDANQPIKAIEAYNRALEMNADDPDVLTDQGVMFRRLGWYDRAIDNFTKANQINPAHPQSVYNLGVVYRYDLQDFARASEAWTRYLEIVPFGAGSDQIRAELEFIQSHPPAARPAQ
jgi:tetratricopeptide (TPR) repeat protein